MIRDICRMQNLMEIRQTWMICIFVSWTVCQYGLLSFQQRDTKSNCVFWQKNQHAHKKLLYFENRQMPSQSAPWNVIHQVNLIFFRVWNIQLHQPIFSQYSAAKPNPTLGPIFGVKKDWNSGSTLCLFVYSRVLPDDFAEFLGVLSCLCVYIEALEIKPWGLGSRILGMEAE